MTNFRRDEKVFGAAYKNLNSLQKKAVDTIEGPVMVMAGPGTGKTTVLTLRIANILRKTDTSADNILALTFTDAGVHSMRQKLVDIIGSAGYKVNIFTFHSFCNEVIINYPEKFPRISGFVSASQIDQIRIMAKVIETEKLAQLKPYGNPFYYLQPVLKEIQNLKREDIDPSELAKIIDRHLEKNKEFLKLYRGYQRQLEKQKLYDYEDMIMEVVRVLAKNKMLLLELQEKYQYILADEHQDANNSQNKLLEYLANFHPNPNLFMVGDEKQAIYRFQGASLENFLYFKRLYPKALLIQLKENYRSTQAILDASHTLITKNPAMDEKLRVYLQSNSPHENRKISIYQFDQQEYEYAFLAKDIAEKLKKGVPAREIAVLYRNNKDALPLIETFRKTDLPFSVISDLDLFSDEDVSKLLILLRAIHNLHDQELLSEMLFIDFLKIPNLDIYKVLVYRSKERILLPDVLSSKKRLTLAGVSDPEVFTELFEKVEQWNRLSKNKGLTEFFEIIVRESGLLAHLISLAGSLDKLDILDGLFSEIKKIVEVDQSARLSDFINYLDILRTHKVMIKRKGFLGSPNAVSLMTAHKSKGLEFEYVYIIDVVDGRFSNVRDRRHFNIPIGQVENLEENRIDDERRLFYVALTRAKKQVFIILAKRNVEGKEFLPSQFITEIDQKLVTWEDVTKLQEIFANTKSKNFDRRVNNGISLKDREYLRNLFIEQGLSVSALNAYLDCSWRYFFNNLIRIPGAPDKWALYGTAVHNALWEFFEAYRKEKDMNKKELLASFERQLSGQPFSEADFKESLEKGRKALAGYFDFYKKSWNRNILTEYTIAGIILNVEALGQKYHIVLKGKLDKIELAEGGEVLVVDYKTKKPVSRNEIEGKTKNSNGDFKRQLVFYKLLLDNYSDKRFNMTAGEIDFIEPATRGKYKKERFVITKEEVGALETLIKKVAAEIVTFSFWNRTCDDKKCAYCALRVALNK